MPFSYKQYCRNVLGHQFRGDAVILYAVSCMWVLKVTVVNNQTLQQYKVRHMAGLKDAGAHWYSMCHVTTQLLVCEKLNFSQAT